MDSVAYNTRRNAASASFLLLVLLLVLCLSLSMPHGIFHFSNSGNQLPERRRCQEELRALDTQGRPALCRYLRSDHPPCAPRGYVDYLALFYCAWGDEELWWSPWLGGGAFALWLLLLFYLLGDTASRYFCASLEGLSDALRLPPAVAGVTLLSLGNGAPDVLSSVVAFASDGGEAGDVGLSGALGGALFVSTVVAGVVAVVAALRGSDAVIDHRGFVRDVCFLLAALCFLVVVLVAGTVTIWTAASFLSLYGAYVLLVSASHCCSADGNTSTQPSESDSDDLAAPLLLPVSSKQAPVTLGRHLLVAFHAPLYLPRRITIPDIAAHRWSRPCAVASALLSPFLLVVVTSPTNPAMLLAGTLTGVVLAMAAASTTDPSAPPQGRYARLLWLAGGFVMSILWSYLLAQELVALLVSMGIIAGVPASVLGVTVLAWGNSIGDLVADLAMVTKNDAAGAQTAVAGCYAGPAFNMVVGLGLSLAMAAAERYPEPYKIPVETSTYVTVGFLVAGLAWALVVLPATGMRLNTGLGVGLLAVYLCFLAVRVSEAMGFLSLDSFFSGP